MNLQPFYRRPGFQTLFGLALWIAAYALAVRLSGRPVTQATYLVDAGLGVITLLVIIALTAQFVLPVRKLDERGAVVQRLFDYLMGARGPVMFIRSGRTVEAKAERLRRGAGVLLVDHASGGVLRTDTQFTRAVGPGVAFTQPGEWLAEPLDLRLQSRRVPAARPDAKDPMALPESLALTEDGIPVSAELTIWFMLDPGHTSAPRTGQFPHLPPYEFNPRAAERAVFGHAYREGADVPWTDLPTLLLVDLWREEVKQWPLQALLGEGSTASDSLDAICDNIHNRLVAQSDTTPDHPESKRELLLLKARGIRVLDVRVDGLQVPQAVLVEHLRRWRERWSSGVDDSLTQGRHQALQLRMQGERRAFEALVDGLTRSLRQTLARGEAPAARDTLLGVLRDALDLTQQPALMPASTEIAAQLRDVLRQLSEMDGDCRPAPNS
jgi:regulator of protease activity HflC (stomatin/prohibitin superfamily)